MKKRLLYGIYLLSFIAQMLCFFNLTSTAKAFYFNFLPSTTAMSSDRYWTLFHRATLDFPTILQHAQQSDIPLIALIATTLDGFTPYDDEAPLIEAMRTAITWISIFDRFLQHHLDIRIIKIPDNLLLTDDQVLSFLKKAAHHSLSKKYQNHMEQRYLSYFDVDEAPLPREKITLIDVSTLSLHEEPARVLIVPPFKDKSLQRLVVTGGSGFIGSHLVKTLLDKNYQVIALDDLSCSTIENVQELVSHPNFFFFKHDVTQPFSIEGYLDGVIHLASLPSPESYYRKPFKTMRAGLHGTKNCLELAREKNARFLFSSTSEVYGDPKVHPQTENYPGNVSIIGPRSQYDQSKRAGETLVKLYFDRYHLDLRVARIFNTYGPHMRLGDGRVVTNFIRAALENKPMLLNGGGKQTRSFGYVDDTVDGIVRLFETSAITPQSSLVDRIFNIGNPLEFTIVELADKINKLSEKYLNRSMPIVAVELQDKTDPQLRCPDITHAQNILHFNPTTSLEEGLEKTFKHFLNKGNTII